MVAVNDWELFLHPLFLDQIEKLTAAVERARTKDPRGFRKTANAKLLASLRQLAFETIPQDPSRPEYRQGGTLGDDRKHWFRAKFGGGRFRLFFRYSTSARIIVLAWVNDENDTADPCREVGRLCGVPQNARHRQSARRLGGARVGIRACGEGTNGGGEDVEAVVSAYLDFFHAFPEPALFANAWVAPRPWNDGSMPFSTRPDRSHSAIRKYLHYAKLR